ncbi:hypothetical protein AB0C65_35840 [Nocardia sp. NPDC048505]|uniref:hypothetical protein n=1 Tax=Nocardia sp. NPDC048505 TaxID=3155756 RepID=UPI0033F5513C
MAVYDPCHNAHEKAHLLRRRYQLPALAEGQHLMLICDSQVTAVTMAPQLGARVLEVLGRNLLAPAPPVVASPRGDRWTMLCVPGAPGAEVCGVLDLAQCGVGVAIAGRRVLLPSADHGTGHRWVGELAPGIGRRLPDRAAVIAAIQQAHALAAA